MRLLDGYAAEVREAHKAEVHALRGSEAAGGYDRVFREDMALRYSVLRLRLAVILHRLRIGDAARMVDRSQIAIDQLLNPNKVVPLQVR